VYDWHKLFSTEERGGWEWVRQGCTTAGIGCIECKAAMAENDQVDRAVRERRVKYYEKNPKQVLEILDAGSKEGSAWWRRGRWNVCARRFSVERRGKEIADGGKHAAAASDEKRKKIMQRTAESTEQRREKKKKKGRSRQSRDKLYRAPTEKATNGDAGNKMTGRTQKHAVRASGENRAEDGLQDHDTDV